MDETRLCGEPELIADYACGVGENPLWHAREKRLLWSDIPGGRLFGYDAATGLAVQFYAGRPVGGFTIQEDGALLLFKDRGTITRWKDGRETTLVEEIAEEREMRFNDVIADPAGRVFCGTYTHGRLGRLYRLETDGRLTRLLDGIGCSNGMAFSGDRKSFFHADSFAHAIYRYDYDEADGAIRNRQLFYTVAKTAGFPDGCTVDAEDCLWFALWGGASLVRLDPAGRVMAIVPMPVQKTSSLTFAGDDLKDIYVTSEGGEHRNEGDPCAGALYRVRSAVAGRAEFFSEVALAWRG